LINTYYPVAGVASAQGLDVSNFQGRFSWDKAKRDVPDLAFGVFRLTEGLPGSHDNSPDPDSAWNRRAIAGAGLVQGAYHFLHPALSGVAQAQYFVEEYDRLGLFGVDMLWLDNEKTDGLHAGAVAACAREFMDELKRLRPDNPMGVYTYTDFANTGFCDGLGSWPLWLAFPASTAPKPPPPWARWNMWQWGLRNGVDADAFHGTIAAFHAWIASFRPSKGPFRHTTDGTKSVTELAAGRNMHPGSWLTLQRELGGATVEDALGGSRVKAGLHWYSKGP
jgi:lysozyme